MPDVSLLIVGAIYWYCDRTVVQVRTVILIALLAIVRKLMIMDMSTTSAEQLLALAAATLALGGVYWLVRDQDRREQA